MSFCQNCGKELVEESTFCPYCGYMIHTADGSYSDGANSNPYNSNPYGMSGIQAPPAQGREKVPGRGFGISSLVLGIVGAFYAFETFVVTHTLNNYSFDFSVYYSGNYGNADLNMDPSEIMAALVDATKIMFSVIAIILCVLALIFALCAFARKYRNGISFTGLILSCIGLVGCVVALIV